MVSSALNHFENLLIHLISEISSKIVILFASVSGYVKIFEGENIRQENL